MARGQKVGWNDRKRTPVEKPAKPMKQETGIWLYPSGKYGALLYDGAKSRFLGMRDTLAAARELRSVAKTNLLAGRAPAARKDVRVTFETFFTETFVPTAMAGTKDSTKRAAKARFNAHLKEPLGALLLGEITYAHLSAVRASLVDREDLSGQTKREVLLVLRQVFEEAVRLTLLPSNPAALLKLPERNTRPVVIPEISEVLRVIAEIHHPIARMMAELLFRSGLRINEATALQWGDIDMKAGRISVRRSIDQATGEFTTPKTGESFRVVDVPMSLITMLTAYRATLKKIQATRAKEATAEKPQAARLPWVFPSEGDRPFNDRNFQQRHWKPAVTRANAPNVTPHGLRHLFASALLQSGAEVLYVANQLGHTSAGFTLKQYGHLLRETSSSRKKLEAAFPTAQAPVGAGEQ